MSFQPIFLHLDSEKGRENLNKKQVEFTTRHHETTASALQKKKKKKEIREKRSKRAPRYAFLLSYLLSFLLQSGAGWGKDTCAPHPFLLSQSSHSVRSFVLCMTLPQSFTNLPMQSLLVAG